MSKAFMFTTGYRQMLSKQHAAGSLADTEKIGVEFPIV
jgi:hypothetical protein